MKRVAHLLAYLVRRQLYWVALYWFLATILVALVHWELLNSILFGSLAVLALIIAARTHDHLASGFGEGVLRVRPVERNHLEIAELVFLFGALIIPLIGGTLAVLISYEARAVSYTTSLIPVTFVASQMLLWYVAGKLSKSFLGALLLILGLSFPVLVFWAVIEIRNNHGSIEVTVFLVLGVAGFLSLLLVFLPFLLRGKRFLFVAFPGTLFLALSGIEWTTGEVSGRYSDEPKGRLPGPGESILVEFAMSPPIDGDPLKDSHWYFFNISSERADEIFVPENFLGSPFTDSMEEVYRYYLWKEARRVMLSDAILRNFPAGIDLRGVEQTWRSYRVAQAPKETRAVRLEEEKDALLVGQKHRLISTAQLPLKSGSNSAKEGFRTAIRKVDFRTTQLLVQVEVSWVVDALISTENRNIQTAWVLYSPSSKRGVLTYGEINYRRAGIQPRLIRRMRDSLEFPLPKTFEGGDDLELHAFILEEGEWLKFEVSIPPGEYFARE